MPTARSCATAAADMLRAGLLAAVLALCACAAPRGEQAVAEEPSAPPQALPLPAAVDRLAAALLSRARLDAPGLDGRTLVIDPLIDRGTGNEVAATRLMERRIADVVHARFKSVDLEPFTPAALQRRPLVLVGSITPAAEAGSIRPGSAVSPVYRIWAAIADLRTGRIVSKEHAWVDAAGVDMAPAAFFAQSPTWMAEPARAAYLRTCAGQVGEAIDPAYVSGLEAAANVAEGIKAYEAGQYQDALAFYREAQARPGGDQSRAYNGIYLTNVALGRDADATRAFGKLVDHGIERGKLAVKFVFQANATAFWPDPAVSGPYPMWLRQIANRGANSFACLRLTGHTSPTGSSARNDLLSLARAERVRTELVSREAVLDGRTDSEGRGSRETVVGSGRDDRTDVLDRRVEFEVRPCPAVHQVHGGLNRSAS